MIDDTLQHPAVRNDVPLAPSRNLSTERVRRHRDRRRKGLAAVTIVINIHEIRELIRLGWLSSDELANRPAIAAAVRGLLGAAFEIGSRE